MFPWRTYSTPPTGTWAISKFKCFTTCTLCCETLQCAAHAKADATPLHCPVCGHQLSRCSAGDARTFQRCFGDITIKCTRGYCQRCHQWCMPAEHALGLDDTAGRRRVSEPIGRGAVEATCRQAQCRFKRPGQCWSPAGDEALLCMKTFWRNQRWSLLFPHTAFNPEKNCDAPDASYQIIMASNPL